MEGVRKISQSEIRSYKVCRRRYELEYKEGLRPSTPSEALLLGGSYHMKIDGVIKDGYFTRTNDKTDAMVDAFIEHILPTLDLVESEKYFEVDIGGGVWIKGFVDGICSDGIPVEHKTSGTAIDEKYIHNLAWDDQVATYMLALGVTEMWYTVCQKPTIRQTVKETLEQYVERCGLWFKDNTDAKIRRFKVVRTKAELEAKRAEIIAIAAEMDGCQFFYRNPQACSLMGCPYSSICLYYDPKFIAGFERRKGYDGSTERGDTENI